jgi:hypothetical protein
MKDLLKEWGSELLFWGVLALGGVLVIYLADRLKPPTVKDLAAIKGEVRPERKTGPSVHEAMKRLGHQPLEKMIETE